MKDYLTHGSIHEAARQDDAEAIKAFVRNGHEVMELDRSGSSALAWSVRYGQPNAVKCLLELGADPNEQSADGVTILHNAVYVGDFHIFMLLVNAGANLRAKDSQGRTIFQFLPNDKTMRKTFEEFLKIGGPKGIIKGKAEAVSLGDKEQVKQAVDLEVTKLRSADFKMDLVTLRDAIGDPALHAAPETEYIKHMQLIYAQLLSAWLTKLYGGGLAKMMADSSNWLKRIQYADASIRAFIEDLDSDHNCFCEYNRAFGSAPTKACEAIISVLETLLLKARIGQNARSLLNAHFSAIYMSYYETMARACGIDVIKDSESRFTNDPQMARSQAPNLSSSGCLSTFLVFALAGTILFSACMVYTCSL